MPRAAQAAVASEVSAVRPDASEHRVQVLQGEIFVQLIQHAPAKIILHARLLQFAGEQSLVVGGVGHALRLASQTARAA